MWTWDSYWPTVLWLSNVCLLASDPSDLQAMLNIAHVYASQWRYTFNPLKSKILVFGESHVSRFRLRSERFWYLGSSPISECDLITHLGLVLSVSRSSLDHTTKCIYLQPEVRFILFRVLVQELDVFICVHP